MVHLATQPMIHGVCLNNPSERRGLQPVANE